jgi:hypothetical protein
MRTSSVQSNSMEGLKVGALSSICLDVILGKVRLRMDHSLGQLFEESRTWDSVYCIRWKRVRICGRNSAWGRDKGCDLFGHLMDSRDGAHISTKRQLRFRGWLCRVAVIVVTVVYSKYRQVMLWSAWQGELFPDKGWYANRLRQDALLLG